jgi:polyhydroxyalkanoate synthesis regulator phasin
MTKGKKWLYMAAGGVVALTLVFGAAFVFINSVAASAGRAVQSVVGTEYTRLGSSTLMLNGFEMGWLGNGDSTLGNYDEALAKALGITVEELQAAYEKAVAAAIEGAVDDGLLTQEQADNLLSGERFGFRGRGGFRGFGGDLNEHLAEALGISVSELEAAQVTARETVMAEAVEAGTITQEQADLMEARGAISTYVQEAMTKAYGEAVEQALADGVINQAQADLLLENGTMGFGGPGGNFGFSGRGKFGGRGAFGPCNNGD